MSPRDNMSSLTSSARQQMAAVRLYDVFERVLQAVIPLEMCTPLAC